MSFRNYIGFIEKKEYNKIKNFTKEELYSYKNKDIEDDYIGVYDMVEDLYELGKYVEEFDKKLFSPVFLNKDLQDSFIEEHDFYKVDKEFFQAFLELYVKNIKSYYKKMLFPFFGDTIGSKSKFLDSEKKELTDNLDMNHTFDFSKITKEEQSAIYLMINHVKSMAQEWGVNSFGKNLPYDLNLEKNTISTSWKYEYAQFELIRIYKTFDWEKNILIYYGY